MLFSLITVTLNNLGGLKATFESISSQNSCDYEWIVIDGASEDGTQQFLESAGAEWSSAPDDGIYDAMNKGMDRAKGEYLLFLNAGDTLASPDTLERISKAIDRENFSPAFIYGDATEDGYIKTARSHKNLAKGMFTHHQAMLYKRKCIGTLRYNTNYKISADYDFTCRFILNKSQVLYLPFNICIFETGGISQKQAENGRIEQAEIRKNLDLCGPAASYIIEFRQKAALWLRKKFPDFYWRLKSFSAGRWKFYELQALELRIFNGQKKERL
jgi:putative colanic acid biosynthesis glycosyltransferase